MDGPATGNASSANLMQFLGTISNNFEEKHNPYLRVMEVDRTFRSVMYQG